MDQAYLAAIHSCPALDPSVRDAFPMTRVLSHGKPYAYLNSAATALKPQVVLDAMARYYQEYAASVHRGVDQISHRSTMAYETARQKVASFLNAACPESIIFTSGTTASINLLALTYGLTHVQAGDEVVLTQNEHHANYVPWQQLCLKQGATLRLAELNERGELTAEALEAVMNDKTRIVACSHMTNVMGAANDLPALAAVAHHYGAVLAVDGAQGVVHERPDLSAWDVDFYAFSGHKLYGPTGIGVLYGKYELLQEMPPLFTGGEMIDRVERYESSFREAPYRFEAGTPPIAEAIGLGVAIDFVNQLGYCGMQKKVWQLTQAAMDGLAKIDHIQVYNPSNAFSGVIAFNVKGVHPHDAASVYDREGIALRAGHHCSQPTMNWLGCNATLRASFAIYNTPEEVERFVETSKKAGDFLDVLF